MGYNWAKKMMEKFKLSNLRELSTEEQLSLTGGNNLAGCGGGSCSCKCPCKGEVNSKEDSQSCAASYYASSMLS